MDNKSEVEKSAKESFDEDVKASEGWRGKHIDEIEEAIAFWFNVIDEGEKNE